jgi:nucleoside diphosphate kinase
MMFVVLLDFLSCKNSILQASEELLKQHYDDLKERPFFPGLVKYMSSGPVVPMVYFVITVPWEVWYH